MLDPLPPSKWSPRCAYHLLVRAGFGGTPAEVDALYALGLDGAVEHILSGEDAASGGPLEIPWSEDDDSYLTRRREIMQARRQGDLKGAEELNKELRREHRQQILQFRRSWIERMIATSFPLLEKMTLFWHGHFATSVVKVREPRLMVRQNELFRTHALGLFPELLMAVTRDGAMIRWLDLQESKSSAPNENFARELLELFTLGEGNYSEEDIRNAARAFTGYRTSQFTGEFSFAEQHHDYGVKKVLGKAGRLDGDDVVNAIVARPQCGQFLGGRLWEFFGGASATPAQSRRLGEALQQADFQIHKFLGRLFRAGEFYSSNAMMRQIKSPVQWLVQSCRVLEVAPPNARVLDQWMTTLGQQLLAPPNVRGWEGGRSWLSSSTWTARQKFAAELAGTSAPGRQRDRMDLPDPNAWEECRESADSDGRAIRFAARFYGPNPPADAVSIATIGTDDSAENNRCERLRAAASAMMQLPEYQLT